MLRHKRYLVIPALLLASAFASAQTNVVDRVTRHVGAGTGMVLQTYRGASAVADCQRDATAPAMCKLWLVAAPPPDPVVCPPAPAASTSSTSQACPTGTTGGPIVTTVTDTYTVGAPDACLVTSVRTSATSGTCTPVVVPPPPPPPPATGTVLHFSDCQAGSAAGCVPGSNSNPGTQAAPKQNLTGVNVNTLPAGSCLLFNRGGAWINFAQRLENMNATAARPLCFDAYGTGPAPVLKVASGNMFNLGGNWGNQTNDGGYVIRNLKLDGMGTAEWGLWFVQNVRDVVLEGTEVTGFRIAINSNDGTPHGVRGITLRNNHIHRNRAMGLLGHYDDMLIEGNLFEANNFSGSTFDHGTYIGGGHNITLRGNRYLRNSTVDGVCRGGNMTFHGQIDGLVIEGNTIEQDAATQSCWLMAITQGYSTAEWFRNAVVRNNVLKNGGQGIVAQSAPGIVVEGNININANINIGSGSAAGADGDVGDVNAVVRNNTICQRAGSHGFGMNSPGGTLTGNVVRTGAEATTGVCAR